MSKPFLTVDAQIIKLYSRGLKISNVNKLKTFLLNKNYYNTINKYSKPFQIKGSDDYIEGTNFSEIVALMEFDKNIKNLFLQKILQVEEKLKSITSYRFSSKYPEKNNYKNSSNFYNSPTNFEKVQKKIERKISFNNQPYLNNAITHYLSKHQHIPLWVLVNFLSFLDIIHFYRILTTDLRSQIKTDMISEYTSVYGEEPKLSNEGFEKCLKQLNKARNIAAHNYSMFNSSYTHIPYIESIHKPLGLSKTDPKNNLYHIYLTLQIFISPKDFKVFSADLVREFIFLNNSLKSIDVGMITKEMGFPRNFF